MREFHVMHGPHGQVHTVSDGGREYVAVWPDMLSAVRYKSRHRELGSYWAVPLDRRLYEEMLFDGRGRRRRFFLMPGTNPGAEVERGRVLEGNEIESELYAGTMIDGRHTRPHGGAVTSQTVAHRPAATI